MDNSSEYAGRLEQCRCLLSTMPPQQILEALQEQMTFEVEELGESDLEQSLIEMLWDIDVMSAYVATSNQIDSSALIEAMDFREDVLVLASCLDKEWRSPTPEDSCQQSMGPQVVLLSKLLQEVETQDICKLLQPYVATGDDAHILVGPLGHALADLFYSEEYLYEAIVENGFLETEPLKASIEQRPDVILLATLPLDETYVETFAQPYIQRLLNIDLEQIKRHAKVYNVELGKSHWQIINQLLQCKLQALHMQIDAAYRCSLNPFNNKSFESIAVLTITQFRLDLDIALGGLFAGLT